MTDRWDRPPRDLRQWLAQPARRPPPRRVAPVDPHALDLPATRARRREMRGRAIALGIGACIGACLVLAWRWLHS